MTPENTPGLSPDTLHRHVQTALHTILRRQMQESTRRQPTLSLSGAQRNADLAQALQRAQRNL